MGFPTASGESTILLTQYSPDTGSRSFGSREIDHFIRQDNTLAYALDRSAAVRKFQNSPVKFFF